MTGGLPKRKVKVLEDSKAVDYGIIKSLIRDEVDLQVKRQLKDLVMPLYQVIMTDPRYELSSIDLPEWLRQLADSELGEDDEVPFMRDDGDIWR